jgi:flagellin
MRTYIGYHMAITVNTNIPAMAAQRGLTSASSSLNQSLERLASGVRINSAKDDAAGLQISNRLETQIRGLDVAVRNANDGVSIMQTAEGAMKETTNILQRIRDLSIQASNGSNSGQDRSAIQEEIGALNQELNRIAETTSFGGRRLLNGQFGAATFQIGASAGEAVSIELKNMRSDTFDMASTSYIAENGVGNEWKVTQQNRKLMIAVEGPQGQPQQFQFDLALGDDIEQVATYINGKSDLFNASVDEDGRLQITTPTGNGSGILNIGGSLSNELNINLNKVESVSDIDVSSVGGAQRAISIVDNAMQFVDSHRAELGAMQNRFGHAINNLNNTSENLSHSKSRIKDTDFAKETTNLIKQQILQQVSTSVLAQAKKTPNLALTLLG